MAAKTDEKGPLADLFDSEGVKPIPTTGGVYDPTKEWE